MGLDKIILPVILKKVKGVMLMIVLREITKAYLNSEKNKKIRYQTGYLWGFPSSKMKVKHLQENSYSKIKS